MYKNVFGGNDRPHMEGKGWPMAETPDLRGVTDLGVDQSFEQTAVRRLAVAFLAGFFSRFIGLDDSLSPRSVEHQSKQIHFHRAL